LRKSSRIFYWVIICQTRRLNPPLIVHTTVGKHLRQPIYKVFLFSILRCSNSKKTDNPKSKKNQLPVNQNDQIIEKRFDYELYGDSLEKEMEYELNKKVNDSSIIYHYKNLTDSEKTMSFKFRKKSNQLLFNGTEFELIK